MMEVVRIKGRAKPHPDYNPDTYNNDIAVIRLYKEIKFSYFEGTVAPICLARWDDGGVGAEVESEVGDGVGAEVEDRVGGEVGDGVGAEVGDGVGAEVGGGVGAEVGDMV